MKISGEEDEGAEEASARPARVRPHADDAGLRAESLPRHLAVVMDGNSRWARERGLPSAAGHEAGRRALEEVMQLSRAWGVRALTAFAFSHEPREPEPAQGGSGILDVAAGSLSERSAKA